MRMVKFFGALSAAGVAIAPVAVVAGDAAATISRADKGTLILRDGRLAPATVGQQLLPTDRVVTRGNAKAAIKFAGCEQPLGATTMYTVASGCGNGAVRLGTVQDTVGDDEGGAGAGTAVVAVLAAVAAGLGVAAGVSGGESDDAPVSP